MAAAVELIVLGIAQDGGLPHLGCTQPCCVRARQQGRIETPACLGLHVPDTSALLLIEATPAITSQIDLLHDLTGSAKRSGLPVDAIAITHAHMGHIAGLLHLGREVAAVDGLPVHVSPRLAQMLESHAPWSQLVSQGHIAVRPMPAGAAIELIDGVTIEALPVKHRDELADTMALRISGPDRRALFCPDIDAWDDQLEPLLEGVDVALLDGTFLDEHEIAPRSAAEVPHPLMEDTMRRVEAMGAARPQDIRFIHCNHSNAALHDAAISRALADRGFPLGQAGDRIQL